MAIERREATLPGAPPFGGRHACIRLPAHSLAGTTDALTGAGWHLMRVKLGPEGGAPRALQVEIVGEAARRTYWTLAGKRAGDVCLVVFLPARMRSLGLRDEEGRDLPAVATLLPLARRQAATRMLGLRGRSGGGAGFAATVRLLATVAGALLLDGRAVAGEALAFAYRMALQRQAARVAPRAVVARASVRRRWWQPGATTHAHLEPGGDLRATNQGLEWEASGDDPQFHLRMPGNARLAPGWYRLRVRLRASSGRILAPCLFPEAGHVGSRAQAIVLPGPRGDGRIRVLLLLKDEVAGLRFDPTNRRARFALAGFRLERLSRVGAWLEMLRGLGGASRLSACARFLLDAALRGPSAAAALLFAAYEERVRTGVLGYASWTRLYDSLTDGGLASLSERGRRLDGPLVSILLPVYDTPERWLRRCLESVLQQAYPHWELCIADDASPSPHVRRVLEEYARREPRIRVLHRERNGHIAEASNSALEMARGEFVALLDHDDELRPDSLLEAVEALIAAPGAGLVYTDEDKIDATGQRFDPYFKPDWNPDLLLSQNYLCHFAVLRTDLVREVGGFRKGYEGSQDHDLFLRCTERLEGDRILHVPKVLYHWRAIEGSTALRRDAKDYAAQAGARAVADHLVRTRTGATVEQLPHGHYRVRWPLPVPAPRVAVIIPTRDRVDLLRACVESLFAVTRYPDFELIVVDNQSAEPATLAYLRQLEQQSRVRVLRYDQPFNYSAMNNLAVAACDADLVALLNNDIEVIQPDWLTEMAAHAMRPEIGAVGAMLYYPDGSIQHAGVILGLGGVANHAYMGQPRGYPGHGGRAKVAQNLSAVTAACLVVRRASYLQVGGFDERLAVAFNDVDFCLRLRAAGLRNLWTPFAELVHHESASRGRDDSGEKMRRFQGEVALMEARWGSLLQADPAYNPNLSLASVNFDLAAPPRHAHGTVGGAVADLSQCQGAKSA
ncbi:MAG: glycosyltransferase family 2 protein [Lysobacteraceae bacterium]